LHFAVTAATKNFTAVCIESTMQLKPIIQVWRKFSIDSDPNGQKSGYAIEHPFAKPERVGSVLKPLIFENGCFALQ
jgi:hypothetical protein